MGHINLNCGIMVSVSPVVTSFPEQRNIVSYILWATGYSPTYIYIF